MRKLRFLLLFILIILSFNSSIWDQSSGFSDSYLMDIVTFMGLLDGIFTDDMIDEITYFLPEELYIINFNVGDFSGDSLYDIAISYCDNTCKRNTYKILLLINNTDTFFDVELFEYEWKYTPYDISFTIKDNICYISHISNRYWVFTEFTYNNKLIKVLEEFF